MSLCTIQTSSTFSLNAFLVSFPVSSFNFDYLGVPTGQGSQHSSQTTLNQSGSVKSSREGIPGKRNGQGTKSLSRQPSSQDIIDKVADAQGPQKSILKKSGSKKDIREVHHAQVMSPIVETRFEEPTPVPSSEISDFPLGKNISPYWNPAFNAKREVG